MSDFANHPVLTNGPRGAGKETMDVQKAPCPMGREGRSCARGEREINNQSISQSCMHASKHAGGRETTSALCEAGQARPIASPHRSNRTRPEILEELSTRFGQKHIVMFSWRAFSSFLLSLLLRTCICVWSPKHPSVHPSTAPDRLIRPIQSTPLPSRSPSGERSTSHA